MPARSVCLVTLPLSEAGPGHHRGGLPQLTPNVAFFSTVGTDGRVTKWRLPKSLSLHRGVFICRATPRHKRTTPTPNWVGLAAKWEADAATCAFAGLKGIWFGAEDERATQLEADSKRPSGVPTRARPLEL